MIILDANIPLDQRQLLRSWRISVHQVGYDMGRASMQDEEILPLLHQLRRPTLFTLDFDFYKPNLCHAKYCLIFLSVHRDDAAVFIRKLLRHWVFDTEAKRMGCVVRVSYIGLTVWRLHEEKPIDLAWDKARL